ncbi:hypothetical protein OG711_06940 [Streptomyces uncialis]|uniref:hypothetical protein n=1 Tax=Streptomyces uncialis TaxID=1048205 RepID=UPI002E354D68|nr:hypothetical protein [Streptomyces uncialis]
MTWQEWEQLKADAAARLATGTRLVLLLTAALPASLSYVGLRRGALPRWWLILAMGLLAMACVRWGCIVQRYPQ